MTLPQYAYTDIEPIEYNKAKKRVIESLARHYSDADPDVYFKDELAVDASQIIQTFTELKDHFNSLVSYVQQMNLGTAGRPRIETVFISRETYSQYSRVLAQIESKIANVSPVILDFKKNISNASFSEIQRLRESWEKLKTTYSTVISGQYDVRTGRLLIKENNMKLDVDKVENQWTIVSSGLQEDIEKPIVEILRTYNERRRNLFTREEVDEQRSGAGYSLQNPDDYKMSEYV